MSESPALFRVVLFGAGARRAAGVALVEGTDHRDPAGRAFPVGAISPRDLFRVVAIDDHPCLRLVLAADDDALAAHIRENVAGTFHPVGTCRMGGANDRDAVVDPEGRVRGIAALRVIDASIMPTAPRGNTNIPTIMVAEKISATMVDEARAAA